MTNLTVNIWDQNTNKRLVQWVLTDIDFRTWSLNTNPASIKSHFQKCMKLEPMEDSFNAMLDKVREDNLAALDLYVRVRAGSSNHSSNSHYRKNTIALKKELEIQKNYAQKLELQLNEQKGEVLRFKNEIKQADLRLQQVKENRDQVRDEKDNIIALHVKKITELNSELRRYRQELAQAKEKLRKAESDIRFWQQKQVFIKDKANER